MNPTDLERVYGVLAETLDKVGTAKSELFLSKLALLLSHEIGDAKTVLGLVEMAALNLDAPDQTACDLRFRNDML